MKIYAASKTKHYQTWLDLRKNGYPIISTWIDEAAPGTTLNRPDLAQRCITEAAQATHLILYCEPGEILKGALLEAGATLAGGGKVLCVGTCENLSPVFDQHPRWEKYDHLHEALMSIGAEGAEWFASINPGSSEL